MADQRKVVVPPKIPPPPPPRSRTPKNPSEESTSPPPGANKASPGRQTKIWRPAPTPPGLTEEALALLCSKPPNPPPVVQPFGRRQPPVSMNPAGRDSPTPKTPSADRTPQKGFFRNVYSRTRDFFSRKKTTTYEPLPKQSASPPTSPEKRGFFRSLFDSKSTTTTTPIRLDDTESDTESSPDRDDKDYSKLDDLTQSDDLNPSGVLQFADNSSDASDLEEAVALNPPVDNCRTVDHSREEQLLTIQVNAAADIRVATTVTGEVTACVRTAAGYKGRK